MTVARQNVWSVFLGPYVIQLKGFHLDCSDFYCWLFVSWSVVCASVASLFVASAAIGVPGAMLVNILITYVIGMVAWYVFLLVIKAGGVPAEYTVSSRERSAKRSTCSSNLTGSIEPKSLHHGEV